MRRRVNLKVVIPLAVVAVLGLFAVVGFVSRTTSSGDNVIAGTVQRALDTFSSAGGAAAPVQGVDTGTAGKSTSGESAAVQDVSAAIPPASTPSAHHLLRTGDLSLLVARGTLLSSVDRIKSMTTAMGGYVMSSAVGSEQPGIIGPMEPQPLGAPVDDTQGSTPTSSSAMADPYATLTVRVPERLFDSALKRFAALGHVQSVSTSSEDVTAQYVDLQARLRHFSAVERRLVGFLGETTNVNQMLTVQDRIDAVQLTIEQLSAQLKSLREMTAYGTLSIYLREKDSAQPAITHSSDTFGGTFWNSVTLLGHGARVTGLVLTALLPFIVVFGAAGLVVWYAIRRLRRGRRQPAQPSLPA